MQKRYTATNLTKYDFCNKIYVICPRCKDMATIMKKDNNEKGSMDSSRLVCKKCSYYKVGEFDLNPHHLDLWLKIACCGNILWAYNEEHLEYIEKYVGAQLRERRKDEYGWHNQSIASRLPRWIKLSKNRDEVLKCIGKLKDLLD
jgi:hypothetical protein